MKIIAHRCGTDLYPELTPDAARHSLLLGADLVEMDVRFTRDGQPVIAHDEDTARLYGGGARICDLTCAQFLALRHSARPEYGSCTLRDMLAGGVGSILLHIKEGGPKLDTILGEIAAHGGGRSIVMGLQSSGDIARVRAFDGNMGVLAFTPSPELADEFIGRGADIIRLWEDWVTPGAVRAIHDRGRAVWVMAGRIQPDSVGYTDPANLLMWRDMGVDGVLVNEVRAARVALGLQLPPG